MMKPSALPEERKLQALARRYRRQGYRVTRPRRGSGLPAFLEGFAPDLIAETDGDRVVIEVKRSDLVPGANDLVQLAERISREPGWRFELVTVPGVQEVSSPGGFDQVARQVRATMRAGFYGPAFLLAWISTETLIHDLAERHGLGVRRSEPAELARELFSAGVIEREEFEVLGRGRAVRNAIAHGSAEEPSDEDVERLLAVAQSLGREIAAAA
jgi:hypothetical protein